MAAVVDFDFEVPQSCEAHEPPEARGLARDEVRLMVATRSNGKLVHARFNELPRFLRAGDLVVVNTSSQIPAAVAATRPDGTALELRLSTPMPDGRWLAELRLGSERFTGGEEGERLALPNGAHAMLVSRYADSRRLWVTELDLPKPLDRYLADHGRPIRYGYVSGSGRSRPTSNVYALEPGSVEPPSAGRPFTRELLTRLVAKGDPRRADRAAHRRLLAGARRAPVSRVVPRARAHGGARQRSARLGRPRRSPSGRRSRARSKRLPRRTARSRPARVGRRSWSRPSAACTRSTA